MATFGGNVEEDQPIHMWSYWRDKRGIVDAVKLDYPTSVKREDISRALASINDAEKYLDFLMTALAEDNLL